MLTQLNWLSRDYNPIVNNIKSLLEKIEALGMPRILQLNGDIKLNGTSIPAININPDLNSDLIVIKGNNTSEIYKVLLEYFYTKTIVQDEDKLNLLKTRMQQIQKLFLSISKNEELKSEINNIKFDSKNVLHYILHNANVGKMLDFVSGNKYNTAREEIYALMQDLTSDFRSARIKPNTKYSNYNPISKNLEDHVLEVAKGDLNSYAARTIENAGWADITLALAEDFDSEGEKLTKKLAKDSYISASINLNDVDSTVDYLYQQFVNKGYTTDIKLNIAGNGIANLSKEQEIYDDYVLQVISKLQAKGLTFKEIRSGGQTGIDEAGTKAAIALNLPWSILAPEGYRFRTREDKERKKDTYDMVKFLKRFDPSYELKNKKVEFIINPDTGEKIIVEDTPKNIVNNVYQNLYSQYLTRHPISMPTGLDEVGMTFAYGENARPGLRSKTTFRAIINGERTSTTRMSGDKGFNLWERRRPGQKLYFVDSKGNKILVEIKSIQEITKEQADDPAFIKEWSEAEGWSKQYFNTKIKPRLLNGETVKWIKYEVSDPRFTKEMRNIATQAAHLANRIVNGENVTKQIVEFLNLC